MYAQVEKPKENGNWVVANSATKNKSDEKQGFGFFDNQSEIISQRKLQKITQTKTRGSTLQKCKKETTSFQGLEIRRSSISNNNVWQFKPEWKGANHQDNFLDKFVQTLDELVGKAATLALNPDDLPELDGYMKLWKDTAVILKAIEDNEIDQDNSDEVEEAKAATVFAAARYGYAIESLACSESGELTSSLPKDCNYELQASRGMTRPDIVVKHKTKGEIAWFDITSSASKGHIDKKTGSGWQTKPYVAEIVYAPLDKNKIGTGKLSIGAKVARKNAMLRRVKAWESLLVNFRKQFDDLWEKYDGKTKTSKTTQAELARSVMSEILGVSSVTPTVAKSVIRALAWSIKDFGFDKGGTKSEGEFILRNMYGT